MKRILCALMCMCFLLLPACGGPKKYETIRYDLFDTEIRLIAYCASQEEMDLMADVAFSRLTDLHRLFDIYHHYDGIVNIYDINRSGGDISEVNTDLMRLLRFGLDAFNVTDGRVNIAMGAVLSLWHDARETEVLPTESALREAARHCSPDDLVLDEQENTVLLRDPSMKLDVGAVAKGWATQQAVNLLKEEGYSDFVLSAGGNVAAVGTKNGEAWQVGVQDPDNPGALCTTVKLMDLCAVTSGGYQRYTEIDGVRYHHIIDPDTLYPGIYVRSATVLCADSALADALSTACFLMPPEKSMALAQKNGARLILVDETGKLLDTAEITG